MGLRIRWSAAWKTGTAALLAAVALRALPGLLEPPAPQPLPADVGLPGVVEVRREPGGSAPRRGGRRSRVSERRRGSRPESAPRSRPRKERAGKAAPAPRPPAPAAEAPRPASAPAPEPRAEPAAEPPVEAAPEPPAEPAAEPAPEPSTPPGDGSTEFAPR